MNGRASPALRAAVPPLPLPGSELPRAIRCPAGPRLRAGYLAWGAGIPEVWVNDRSCGRGDPVGRSHRDGPRRSGMLPVREGRGQGASSAEGGGGQRGGPQPGQGAGGWAREGCGGAGRPLHSHCTGPGASLRFAGGAGGPAGAPCGEARNSSVDSLSPVAEPERWRQEKRSRRHSRCPRERGGGSCSSGGQRGGQRDAHRWGGGGGRTWFSDRRCLPAPQLASRHRRPQPRPHKAASQPRPGDLRRKMMATGSGRGSRWGAWDVVPSRELLLTLLLGSGPAPGCPPWQLLKRTVDGDSCLKWWPLRRASRGPAGIWFGRVCTRLDGIGVGSVDRGKQTAVLDGGGPCPIC